MSLNKSLLEIFNILYRVEVIRLNISINGGIVDIKNLFRIDPEELILVDKVNVKGKIDIDSSQESGTIDLIKLERLISEIHSNITRLNHLGINYSCRDIKSEIKRYKKLLIGSRFKIYEEDSGNLSNRWFFIGEASKWREPMFEIVLTQSEKSIVNKWIPHFQIDIDTNLSYEEIRKITDKIFGKNFIMWKMDLPNYGVPMIMGLLGKVSGTKIYLGIGTNLRKTEIHRKVLLKEI